MVSGGKRGRPRRPRPLRRYTIALYLDPLLDAALIAALDAAPPRRRSATVREWLRSGFRPDVSSRDEDPLDLDGLGICL
ncbi:MAG: hypothetical protein QN160_09995 [Armatimonadota bacterium]|nr:hypothetical protein [Armatimonadota bacterium]MDR7574241.1 hypothetical protein [Armatimonadota bacterium]